MSYLEKDKIQRCAANVKAAFMNLTTASGEFIESLSRATDHRKRFYSRLDLWAAKLAEIGLGSELNTLLSAREV